ncbi:LysR family transcriptional regulator [Brevundimonas sp.]|uniref:LysR family transcriptional regulator n=1 Tax=Brevundimonas sp. TaxID=1871086 RepID=UPI002FC762BE
MFQNLTGSTSQISLTALRAFEAMARTGSATAAAAELHVTHSAVSRQVKSLEQQLGLRLFDGPKHALRLTEKGAALATELHPAFDRISAAVTHARGQSDELSVAVHASLSVKWLIPRLARFHQLYPHIHIHLIELSPHAETHRGADAVIRLMKASELESAGVERIAPNAIGPVISTGRAGTNARAALVQSPRLISRTQTSSWADWEHLSGVQLPSSPSAPRSLAHLHFVLDAVLADWGAAVLPLILCADAISRGQLVAPYGFAPDAGGIGISLTGTEPSRAQRSFLHWLRQEALPSDCHPHTPEYL